MSNGTAAMFLSIVKGFIVSTSTGQHNKNSHRLATLHFSFCVANKPSYPYAGLAECARRVSIKLFAARGCSQTVPDSSPATAACAVVPCRASASAE